MSSYDDDDDGDTRDDMEMLAQQSLDYMQGDSPLLDEGVYIEVMVKQYLTLMQILASPELKPELREGTLQMAKALSSRFIDRLSGVSYPSHGQYRVH